MECRPNCAACCICLSISSAIPGMPGGKPAGVRCVQLSEDLRCNIFGHPDRPQACTGFIPERQFCGESSEEAYRILSGLEGNSG
ncbi:MAG: YkgJ family cysteine cluster protein [Bacteroidetes bacterium]|nr:YkgJ family cysteine cluster protein [Bacteroidota bacterium]